MPYDPLFEIQSLAMPALSRGISLMDRGGRSDG